MISFGYFSQTPTELIVNGGFEQSKSLYPWVVETTKGGVLVSGPNENGNPHGGNRYVTLGGTNKEKDAIYQSVIVPGDIQSLTLSFALKIKSTGNDKNAHDYLRVFLKGEAIDVEIAEFSNLNETDWRIITIDSLQTCTSQSLVSLLFEASTDGTKPTKFMIDDVSLKYTPSANTPTTPNFEFISPRFGCIYPSLDYQTISGAQPLTLLAYAPNGIQSFYAELDGEVIATTDQSILQVPVNWSSLLTGDHTLQGTLIDKDGFVLVKRCAIPSTNLLEGADFEFYNAWSESSTSNLSLVKSVDPSETYDGSGVAILGGTTGTTDILEQMIYFPGDSEDTATLSFFYNTPINSSITKTSLQIQLVDAETDALFPIANIAPTSSGWTLIRVAFSLSQTGLQTDNPYWLQFKVVSQQGNSQLTPFYLDDVALYVYSATLAAGTSGDPTDLPGIDETSSAPGPKPSISYIDRHFGKKEGGDTMNIYGSGFDPNNITVNFGRIKTSTTWKGNYVRRVWNPATSMFDVNPVDYTKKYYSGWINSVSEDGTKIILAPDNTKNNPPNCPAANTYGCGTPSSYDDKFGKVRIVVKNGNGNKTGFGWQNGLGFRYGYPTPTINSISPTSISIVGGGTDGKFDIYGNNFIEPATVYVGDIRCEVTFIDSTHLTAMLPYWNAKCCSKSCLGVVNSPRKVKVVNPDGQSAELSDAMTLLPGPSPVISNFLPQSGSYQGGTIVTIKGQNFSRVSSIKVGQDYADCGSSDTTINDSRTQLTLKTPASCNGPIAIYTQDETYGVSSEKFKYDDPSRPITYTDCSANLSDVLCTDQDITFSFNGSPQCDAINLSNTTVSLTPTSNQNQASLNVSKKSVSTTDSARKLVLTFTKADCPSPGEGRPHKLTLNLVTDTGISRSYAFDVLIKTPPAENLSVTAAVTSISGLTAYFSSNASGGTSPYTYLWNFGDGTTSTIANPSHTYTTGGTYSVTLTIKDSLQNQASASLSVAVGSSSTLTVTASATPSSSSSIPVTVQFSASANGGYSPYTYYWTFGDGGSSTLQNPSHTYQTSGIFTAVVKVTDSHNQTVSKSLTIKVGKITIDPPL